MDITPIKKPIFKIDVPTLGVISCRTCTLSEYRMILSHRDLRNIFERVVIGDIPQTLSAIYLIWSKNYLTALNEFFEENKDALEIPTDGQPPEKNCRLKIFTVIDKITADYTGLNFIELGELDIVDYKLLSADAYKHMIMQNKKDAADYLNGCWCYMHDKFTLDTFSDEITII